MGEIHLMDQKWSECARAGGAWGYRALEVYEYGSGTTDSGAAYGSHLGAGLRWSYELQNW